MCNPPFYDSHEEIAASLAKKELEPFSVRLIVLLPAAVILTQR